MPENQQETIDNLIGFIINFAKKNNITAYQLGKYSSISASSVNKIFSKENKSPKLQTLFKLQEDLEDMVVGTKSKYELKEKYQSVEETNLKYDVDFSSLKIDDKLNIINEKLDLILTKI